MTESNSLMVKREWERELKKHQERIQNMKPCINSKRGIVRESFSPETKRPVRVRIDKGKLRQIEQQNYRLLMRLQHIQKNYSLYMPKQRPYLERGDAGRGCNRVKKPAKKQDKSEETNDTLVTSMSRSNHFVDGEIANRVAGMNLRKK